MELHHETDADGILHIRLTGSLDIAGADKISLAFNALAGTGTRMLVDMRETSFVASMGLRLLLTVGKAVIRRGGKIVLMGANAAVHDVLITTGVDSLMPLVATHEAALAALAG